MQLGSAELLAVVWELRNPAGHCQGVIMAVEIERKFLVANADWRDAVLEAQAIVQGYLLAEPGLTVRVRIKDDQAYLTIKGAGQGIRRLEFEYGIPPEDAQAMLQGLAQGPWIEKTRYRVAGPDGHLWEVDVFAGDNAGLVLAELELDAEDAPFQHPAWLGREVSDDPRYYNARLMREPFVQWGRTDV